MDEKDRAGRPRFSPGCSDSSTRFARLLATRREVLKTGAAAATVATLSTGELTRRVLGKKPDEIGGGGGQRRTELRDLFFDFSAIDTSDHDLLLVAGMQRLRIQPTPAGVLRQLRRVHPVLERVPDSRATHWLRAHFPAEGVQVCYVQRFRREVGGSCGPRPGLGRGRCGDDLEKLGRHGRPWDFVSMFYHAPRSAVLAGAERVKDQLRPGEPLPVPVKWAALGLTAEDLARYDDPVGLDIFKTDDDTASAMVSSHPEMICGDDTSQQYIQQKYVGPAPQTGQLGEWITKVGPCNPQTDWTSCGDPVVDNTTGYGTNVPICNPDTGEQRTDSNTGALEYQPIYTEDTNTFLCQAIAPSLQQVKADTTLGANVTSNPDPTSGLVYRYQDGATTSDQTDGVGLGSGLGYTTKDYSPGHGYSVCVTDVQTSSDPDTLVTVTLELSNWFVRFLGVYVRYLDANDNPIPLSDLPGGPSYLTDYSIYSSDYNTTYDAALDLLGAEFEILGIPLSEATKTVTIPVPTNATSFLLLGSSLGNTPNDSNPYSGTLTPGSVMTVLFDLALPSAFLALNAVAGLAPMAGALRSSTTLRSLLPTALSLLADDVATIGFNDPSTFKNVGINLVQALLKSAADPVVSFVYDYLEVGEETEALEDSFPICGVIMSAIYAAGAVAALAQTSTQIATSPSSYSFKVTLTHDVSVTISHDPNDVNWPATATYYLVVIQFDDGGTPHQITAQLPSGTVSADQTVTFQSVPLGGNVTASVQVYSDTGFQVGVASAGPFANVEPADGSTLDLHLTLTEIMVPITSTTVYSHKEVITLDADGDHVWTPTTTPPTQEPPGCNPSAGQLCQLTGITINTTAGAVGQSFQSYDPSVVSCSGGEASQLHQFSNLSITQDPQSAYFFSGCGFSTPPRLAYDLLNRPDYNFYLDTTTTGPTFQGGVIRQIRLGGTNPGFDEPDSNLAWGKLLFSSDAFLLHPAGQIISVNTSYHKVEVVRLPAAAVPDAMAPNSQVYGGLGLRAGLMSGPTLAALAADGTLLVLEVGNTRIQAFDLNANPARKFGQAETDYFFPLKDQPVSRYLDFSVEFAGYMYVLWADVSGNATLDIYDPQGNWLTSTPGLAAQRITVNYWRDLYAQNSQVLRLPNGGLPPRTEPSISHWIPSTP
jgi:hypothetical protein